MIEISNKEFLSSIFGSTEYQNCHITSFDEDPKNLPKEKSNLVWSGKRLDKVKNLNLNQYFTVSLFNSTKRRKDSFKSLHCIVIDDVKEKIPVSNLSALPEPSWILETSKGSEQWGYILSNPCTNINHGTNLISGLINSLCPDGKDTGMASVTRYVRLPEGYNTKKDKLIQTKPFKCKLLSWSPVNKYSLSDLAKPFNIDINKQNYIVNLSDLSQPDHPIFSVPDLIQIKKIKPDNWIEITCPWKDSHTDKLNNGTAIHITPDGSIRFKCHHGHCENKTYKDFIQYITENNPDWLELYNSYLSERKETLGGRAEIFYNKSNVTEACKAISTLFKDTPEYKLFRRNGRLIKIGSKPPATMEAIKNSLDPNIDYPDAPYILELNKDNVREEIESLAVCRVKTKKDITTIAWPHNILTGVLSLNRYNEHNLISIIEHPYVDNNFQPVTEPGYDPNTGLYKCFDEDIKDYFSQDSDGAKEAIKYLAYEVFDEFPFKDLIDRYTTVSCLLAGMQRKFLSTGCPGYLFSAPIASSGKTELAHIISHALYRCPAAAAVYADNDTEMSKHLLSILREGQSSILFDNLPAGGFIESNEIAKAITSQTYSGRLLSLNTTVTLPTTVLFMLTGNNVKVVGDFNTRILIVDLDPNTDNPDQRIFKRINLYQWILDNRDKILSACLTILSQGAGYDPKRKNPSRFKEWNKFIWYPIFKFTGIDIAVKFQENKSADPKIEVNRTFFESWYDVFEEKEIQVSELISFQAIQTKKLVEEKKYDKDSIETLKIAYKDFFSTLKTESSGSVGKCLSREAGRCYGEFKLVKPKNSKGKDKKKNGSNVWKVIKLT